MSLGDLWKRFKQYPYIIRTFLLSPHFGCNMIVNTIDEVVPHFAPKHVCVSCEELGDVTDFSNLIHLNWSETWKTKWYHLQKHVILLFHWILCYCIKKLRFYLENPQCKSTLIYTKMIQLHLNVWNDWFNWYNYLIWTLFSYFKVILFP